MINPYVPRLSPTVGKGLGGLPRRKPGEGIAVDVGDVLFTDLLEDTKFMQADGTSLVAAEYPELFAAWGEDLSNYLDTETITPSSLPTSVGWSVAFSSDDTYLAVGHESSPYVTIYKRSGDTFTKLADPSSLPDGNGYDVAFSSDDTYLAVAYTTSPYVTIYKRSGDTFTKLAAPSSLPTGGGRGVAFSSVGINYLAVAHYTSPYVTIYPRIDSAPLMIKVPDLANTVASMEDQYPPTISRTAYMKVKP